MEENEVVETPEQNEDGVGALIMGKGGVTQKASRKPRKKAAPVEIADDKTIVYSAGNISWPGVGTLKAGFNLVSKEAGKQWTTLKRVREASIEEVKEFYGR